MNLDNFSTESRLWVYQADRFFDETEKLWLQEQINEFTEVWASHGTQLKAGGLVYNDFTIVLSVDTSHANSSGCSIDKSVHFIKDLGKILHVDFFNRLKVWVKDENGDFSRIPFKDLKDNPNAVYFDGTVQTLSEFKAKFEIKASELN